MSKSHQYRWYTSGGAYREPVLIRATSDVSARQLVEIAAVELALKGIDIGRGVITIQRAKPWGSRQTWEIAGVVSTANIRKAVGLLRQEAERVTAEARLACVGGDVGGGEFGGGGVTYSSEAKGER